MSQDFLDLISVKWIENGLSLKRKEAGSVTRTEQLPDDIERENGVHYYTFKSNNQEIIFAFDRSKDAAKPTAKYVVK